MTEIDLRQISVDCGRLEELLTKQVRMMEELEVIRHKLNNLSGMDNAKAMLREEMRQMESQRRSLVDLTQGLSKIGEAWQRTEETVVNHAEGSSFRAARSGMAVHRDVWAKDIRRVPLR
ncbi:MAG: hypothetical protein IJ679_09870 [Lachnospiraceae bacterium]|nr:hypothetical protein [Lachnospiraceae bacterium]